MNSEELERRLRRIERTLERMGLAETTSSEAGTAIYFQEEGTELGTAGTLNVVGANAEVTVTDNIATLDISGVAGTISIQAGGVDLGSAEIINVTGEGATITVDSDIATLDIPAVELETGNAIQIFYTDGSAASEQAATDAGVDAAGALSNVGRIEIPSNAVLTANHTLAAVEYVFLPGAQVSGQLTPVDGTIIHGLRLARTVSSSADVAGLVRPVDGNVYLYDCEISVTQSGAGRGFGILDPEA